MAFLLSPKATTSLPRALPAGRPQAQSPAPQPAAVTSRGEPKLVEKHCISSGVSSSVFWLGVTKRGLWGTKKHHGRWLSAPGPRGAAVGQQWPLWNPGGAGGCWRKRVRVAGGCPSPCHHAQVLLMTGVYTRHGVLG